MIWVSWGVLFKGLGVQKDTQTPYWLRPWGTRSSLTILVKIIKVKTKLEKYLMEKYLSEHHRQLSFKYIVK